MSAFHCYSHQADTPVAAYASLRDRDGTPVARRKQADCTVTVQNGAIIGCKFGVCARSECR
eukprot:m.251290 g.251290  ORF g.251290 m.251290 type:complete len:61 (-) comp54510_c1_seq101:268-450(-)